MKNTFGNAVSMTIFGESHGPAIGAVLDGLAAGLPVDEAAIADIYGTNEEAEAGSPEAQARYDSYLAARRESYHKKKQDEKGAKTA